MKTALEGMTGFRGIGIWAGFQACDRLVMVTTKKGVKKRFRLAIEFKDILKHVDDNINIKQLVDPRYKIEWEDAAEEEHYTRVTLERIHDDYKLLLDPKELVLAVSQTMPCRINPSFQHAAAVQDILANTTDYQEFSIKIATAQGIEEAFRQFPSDPMDVPEIHVLKDELGTELAKAWFCRSQKTALRDDTAARGFRMRIRNFGVGPMNIYSDEDGSAFGVSTATRELKTASRLIWFCGEVHVTNEEILPNTPRNALEVNALSRRLIEEIRKFYKVRIEDAGAHSDFNGFKKAIEDAKALIARSNGKPLLATSDEEKKRAELLTKIEDTVKKTRKGDSGAKTFLRNLINRSNIKTERNKTINLLKSIAGTAPPATAKATAKGNQSKGTTGKSDKTGLTSFGGAAVPLDFEDLITEVVQILEDHLGEEHDEIAPIAEEIKEAFKKRGLHNAGQPVS